MQWGRLAVVQIQAGTAPLLALRRGMHEVYSHNFSPASLPELMAAAALPDAQDEAGNDDAASKRALDLFFDRHFLPLFAAVEQTVEAPAQLGTSTYRSGLWPRVLGAAGYAWSASDATLDREGAVSTHSICDQARLLSMADSAACAQVYEMLLGRCAYLAAHDRATASPPAANTLHSKLSLAALEMASARNCKLDIQTELQRYTAMLELAGARFIQHATVADWRQRQAWLLRVGRRYGDGQPAQAVTSMLLQTLGVVFDSELTATWQDTLHKAWSDATSLPPDQAGPFLAAQPVELRLAPATWMQLTASSSRGAEQPGPASEYGRVLDMLSTLIVQIMPQRCSEAAHIKRTAETAPLAMTAVQLSCAAMSGSAHRRKDDVFELLRASRPLGVVEMLHPTFQAYERLLSKLYSCCCDSSAAVTLGYFDESATAQLQMLLAARQRLWQLVCQPPSAFATADGGHQLQHRTRMVFALEPLIVQWRTLSKLCARFCSCLPDAVAGTLPFG